MKIWDRKIPFDPYDKVIAVDREQRHFPTRYSYPDIYGLSKYPYPKLFTWMEMELAWKMVREDGFTLYFKDYDDETGEIYYTKSNLGQESE